MRVGLPRARSYITWVVPPSATSRAGAIGPPSETTRYSIPNEERETHDTRASHTMGSPKNAGTRYVMCASAMTKIARAASGPVPNGCPATAA